MENRRMNVLVTGVGAIIGYGVISSLRRSKYDCNIIGTDIYPDAVGQAWCDTFIRAVPASDENYIEFIMKVMSENDIDLVMFGTEQEITRLSQSREQMGDYYDKLVLNRPEIVDLSNDKWHTYQFLKSNGLPAIPSMIKGDFDEFANELGCPFLLKPRNSYAGKGMEIIKSSRDLDYFRENLPSRQFMAQKLIGDNEHEYTTATFGFGDGTGLQPIMLRRKLSQEGATAKATRIDDSELSDMVMRLTNLLKPVGPTNYQFRFYEGKYYLLEVNPRISASTSIRMELGYNEAEMCIDWFVNSRRPGNPLIRNGSVVRYISDWVRV